MHDPSSPVLGDRVGEAPVATSHSEATCAGCRAPLDPFGRHRVSCTRTGRVKTRAGPVERVMARICREAGATVRFNALLRDVMNIGVRATDRHIEVLAQDLSCFGSAQLAVDVTLRGVLSSEGEPHPHASDVDGAVLLEARRDKERTYLEVVAARRWRLVVVAIETGGRWSEEAVEFTTQRERCLHTCFGQQSTHGSDGGPGCSRPCAPSLLPSLVEQPAQCESWCWTGGSMRSRVQVRP